jgi:excisionase family DNA binding protein
MDLDDSVKIGPLADEMGITPKTIYNWINDGRLEMVKPGFVSRISTWAVMMHMQEKRTNLSHIMSAYGIKRDAYGRFISESDE